MKIYVVTHEPVALDLPPDYELFQVGAAINGAFLEHNDAVGEDNISAKNPNYCELTAAYWIWKNDHENDIVGLMHYRRFLTTSRFSKSNKHYVTAIFAEKLLDNYDFIAPKKYGTGLDVKQALISGHVYEKDFELLRNVIVKLYPDYETAFDGVFRGKKTFPCNIFIAKKDEWDKYYAWLFSIFDEMEKHVDMTDYSKQERRLYGYLSERLFTVYVVKNNKRVKELRMLAPKPPFFKRVKNRLKRIFHR